MRALSTCERDLLDVLVGFAFESAVLREQLESAELQNENGDGTILRFSVRSPRRAGKSGIVAEMTAPDSDGPEISAFIKVSDGILHWLEILRVDGQSIKVFPSRSEWKRV